MRLTRVVNGAMRICGNRIPTVTNVGENHQFTCWLAKLEGLLMSYVWETDNLVKSSPCQAACLTQTARTRCTG